ncbi:unnamed protein product [Spirodela intermedia]|uniref:Uncharacterized protein n=1 Tax=Spirodela intermedia TaxID=51605 RepID=A0A7I8J468_SPIIN|nr:unnamed protein product [Spirodela intermedia]CAA6664150.1 unnamed protein product [Spirodela intermedia]
MRQSGIRRRGRRGGRRGPVGGGGDVDGSGRRGERQQ